MNEALDPAMLAPLFDDGDCDPVALTPIPYFKLLGLKACRRDGVLTTIMPFDTSLIGNPMPPRLHGGTLGALLEAAAMLSVIENHRGDIDDGSKRVAAISALDQLARPIGLTVDYLRPGEPKETYASATILRRGRRIASVRGRAWQETPQRPVAAAMLHFLL